MAIPKDCKCHYPKTTATPPEEYKALSMPEILSAIEEGMLSRFCDESDTIEGEEWNDSFGFNAAKFALTLDFTDPEHFKQVHKIIGQRVNEPWVGKWRKVQVFVGSYVPPKPEDVQKQMEILCGLMPDLNSWQAHNHFERIHPFQDFNGRVGRLLWLSIAYRKERYRFGRSFLHEYYYQTLRYGK